MKSYLTLFFVIIATVVIAQPNSSLWKGNIDLGGGFALTTFLEIKKEENKVVITSPEDADIRLAGGFKARMGRLLGKLPKKGVFVTIEADQKGDSLFGTATAPVLGILKFKGILKEDLLSGNLLKDDTLIMATITGTATEEKSIDYTPLYPLIMQVTQDNIYSKEVLETREWLSFQKDFKKLSGKAQDDIELFLGFSILSQSLPFSHYSVFIQEEEETENSAEDVEPESPTVIFERKDNSTAYLKIKNFSSSQEELAAIFPEIVENDFQNLIVDLRDNSGGGIEPAFEFAKYIADDSIKVGYFVTNKLDYSGFDSSLFEELPEVEPQTTDEFIEELKTGRGAKLVFQKPGNRVFAGNLYILTNTNTASTCEPIAYVLEKNAKTTIVGENTAGAMLSSAPFDISGKYKLVLPIADFYTYDGVRLEGVGVKPNIETKSEDALNKAMEMIQANGSEAF